jgi:hypothetical protein
MNSVAGTVRPPEGDGLVVLLEANTLERVFGIFLGSCVFRLTSEEGVAGGGLPASGSRAYHLADIGKATEIER